MDGRVGGSRLWQEPLPSLRLECISWSCMYFCREGCAAFPRNPSRNILPAGILLGRLSPAPIPKNPNCQAFPTLSPLGHLEPGFSACSGYLVPGRVTSGMVESMHSHVLFSPLMSCDRGWQERERSLGLKDMQLHTE